MAPSLAGAPSDAPVQGSSSSSSRRNGPGAAPGAGVVVFITGDRDFAHTIFNLKLHGFRTCLIHDSRASADLLQSAHHTVKWERLLRKVRT